MHWDCSRAHCCRYSTVRTYSIVRDAFLHRGIIVVLLSLLVQVASFPGRALPSNPHPPNNFPIPQPQRQILISIRAACLADAYATVQRSRCRDAEGLHCAYRWSTDSLLACCILYIVQDCIHDITTYMMYTCEDILYSIYCTASSSHRKKAKRQTPRASHSLPAFHNARSISSLSLALYDVGHHALEVIHLASKLPQSARVPVHVLVCSGGAGEP